MATSVRNDLPRVVKLGIPNKSAEQIAYESKSKFGIMAPEFRVYIEGVQVPFETIYINDNYGQIPTASITLPYLPFLQEIGRNYPAKVHIFFRDIVAERYHFNRRGDVEGNDTEDYEFRVAFIGVIKGATYQKNKNPFGASSTISFQCQHKNYVASEISMAFAQFNVNDASVERFGDSVGSTAGMSAFNPTMVAQQAMQGVDVSGEKIFNPIAMVDKIGSTEAAKDAENFDTSGVPKSMGNYYEQFSGVPGVILRLWNLMCLDAYQHRYQKDFMSRIYIPLMSKIKYFEGMVGHPIVENHMEAKRVKPEKTVTAPPSSTQLDPLNPLGAGVSETTAFGAIATQAAESAMLAGLNQSTGSTTFDQLYNGLLQNMLYESVTLCSPAMRLAGSKDIEVDPNMEFVGHSEVVAPVETIIRPLMPMYFSPRCNVIYPRMYSSVQINDLYDDAPTRINARMPDVTQSTGNPIANRYRSPKNVREATFNRIKDLIKDKSVMMDEYQKANLEEGFLGTVNMFHETPASHEMGRGVKSRIEEMPQWLMYIVETVEEGDAAKDSPKEKTRRDFRKMLMDYTDYLYSLANSSYRSGGVSCCYNPYIIPGYPMDVVDPSQDRPSHHAFCTSVTHVISSMEARTEVGFSNAMTYEELYAYSTPTALPWLEELLKISKKEDNVTGSTYTSIVNASEEARAAANQYYLEVLGVGAAFVDDLSEYKYSESETSDGIKEVKANVDSLEDSLAACRRSIQTKASVEALYGLKFINTKGLPALMSNGKVLRDYPFRPPVTKPGDTTKDNYMLFTPAFAKPGHSMFLDYSSFVTDPARVVTAKSDSIYVLGGNVVVTGGDVNSDTDYAVRKDYLQSLGKLRSKLPNVAAYAVKIDNELLATYGNRQFPQNYKQGLFLQLIHVESSYIWDVNTTAKDPQSHAWGYGQILPKFWDGKLNGKKVRDLTYEENLELSKRILLDYFTSLRNWNDAVVAYNQGIGTVKNAIEGGRCFYKLCKLDHGGATYFNKVFTPGKA